jgi:hypothetical protein
LLALLREFVSILSLFVVYLMEYRDFQMMWVIAENSKIKVVPTHAMTTYRGGGGIATFILCLSTKWNAAGQIHASAAVTLEKNPGTH